ncbi:MAG: hypothetical protein IKR59_00925 [Lachnospiraceae bacterium]|nr:hypothetical protein [Lachnospiraceae bacterium]
MKKKYSDIIHLPHHQSSVHPQMPITDRAAQFSPFASLTGYEKVISSAGEAFRPEDLEYFDPEEGPYPEEEM